MDQIPQIPEPPAALAGSGAAAWVYLGGVITAAVATLWNIFGKSHSAREEQKVVSTTVEMVDSSKLNRAVDDLTIAVKDLRVCVSTLIDRHDIRDERLAEINRKIDDALQRIRDAEIRREARAEALAEAARDRGAREG